MTPDDDIPVRKRQLILKPTKQKLYKRRIFGFDIETSHNNREFLSASIVGMYPKNKYGKIEVYEKYFESKEECIHEFKTNKIFRNADVFATNLQFDFMGTFFNTSDEKCFRIQMRGSHFISATTYFDENGWIAEKKRESGSRKQRASLRFLDTMNYSPMSVQKLGKFIGLEKLKAPIFLGQVPQTPEQMEELRVYNINDSWISYRFMMFFIPAVESIGCTFKTTIAATAMSGYRNKYLKDQYFIHDEKVLLAQLNALYGGRTEAHCRGFVTNLNYYDINSLYPSVMWKYEYPDPNSLRIVHSNNTSKIMLYHGVSDCTVNVPYMKIPPLPVHYRNKTLFPCGTLKGWWTHIELRHALELGCTIIEVRESHYYTRTCRPFVNFVKDMYDMRRAYQKESNPMQEVVKLIMNSLYGKFGQKWIGKDNIAHEGSVSLKELNSWASHDRIGNYFFYKKDGKPSSFSVPIWACYVTAYGRLTLYPYLTKCQVFYNDTDSVVTPDTLPTSTELGDIKLELQISEGYIVRPKMYGFMDSKLKEYVKVKGLGRRLSYLEFKGLLKDPQIDYTKFTKTREGIRRGLIPNEIITVHKEFSLEDEKRVWQSPFNPETFQTSEPLFIDMTKEDTLCTTQQPNIVKTATSSP